MTLFFGGRSEQHEGTSTFMHLPMDDKYCLPNDGFVRLAQLIPQIIPVSETTFWRMVSRGDFPAPVRLSGRVIAWRVSEVRAWIDAR